MRILSSAEEYRRVVRRFFFTTSVAGSFSGTLPQPTQSVSRVLTADKVERFGKPWYSMRAIHIWGRSPRLRRDTLSYRSQRIFGWGA